MAWQTARNMDRLRTNARSKWPGITIYDIGDIAHAQGVSGHNPDDMVLPQGGRAELSDPDGLQEVRALDFMINSKFTAANARELVTALRDIRSRRRLYYVIYNRRIYRRDGSDSPYTGSDPHTGHVHASGWWEDDANTADWTAVLEIGDDMPTAEEIATAVWNQRIASEGLNRSVVAADWLKSGYAAEIALRQMSAVLNTVASKVDLDPTELEAIKTAAREGAMASTAIIIDGVLAGLPSGDTVSKEEVKQALTEWFTPAVEG